MRIAAVALAVLLSVCTFARAAGPRIPILHSTDLFHPHEDPDDHYDLACLFSFPEFDVRGVILDLGATQSERTGAPAVEQMMHVAGRRVPYAAGLSRPLRSPGDPALDEPAKYQGAVELILRTLRESPEKVVLFTTGSCRDVAAAYNREPELLRAKVRGVYFNIGRGPNEPQEECNVGYDPQAYMRMFQTGLPLYWCPCFGRDGYETYYTADQAAVVGACVPAVRNYFVYCLSESKEDPIAFLASGPHPLPAGPRNMWCTAPMFHAAGRKIYQRGADDFVALAPDDAEKQGLAGKEVPLFDFLPMRAAVGEPAAGPVKLAEPAPGQLAAAYVGRTQDRVGTGKPEPDGRADCQVRALGVDPQKPIRNMVLTGPKEGRWEYVETGRWWRVAYQREGKQLDCWFQFYAPGEHQVEIVYEDGTSQAAKFMVPDVAAGGLRIELNPAEPNGFVFRAVDPRYKPAMASCLKNLLAGLGRDD